MTIDNLKMLLGSNQELIDIDLSGQVLEDLDFSNHVLTRVNFKDATLVRCKFDDAVLERCNFDHSGRPNAPTITQVSFRKAQLTNCRFRYAYIVWTDFRYAEFNQATMEDSVMDYCDFYRCFFQGVVLFRKAVISNSSINNAYFGDAASIRRDNLKDDKIIQEDKKAYIHFLKDWKDMGTGLRKNDSKEISAWEKDEAVKCRWADAEDIYKQLNGLWAGRGFFSDANWAYVQGRRMELHRLCVDIQSAKPIQWVKMASEIVANALSNLFFGYGESMVRMIITYIVAVFLFAWFFLSETSILEYSHALIVSLKNMVGMDSEELDQVSPLVDMLNVVQTTIGIILTGIFGFILGNKIRNQ